MLYRTRSPNDEQLNSVRRLVESGALLGRSDGGRRATWTTTEAALAEFMAQWQLRKISQDRRRDVPSPNGASGDRPNEAAHLELFYRGMWRDYFLAVMLRRRMTHRSTAFRRAVLAGQVVVLALLVGFVLGSVREFGVRSTATTEQRAIEAWIAEHTDAHVVTRWHPPSAAADGVVVCVQYRYRKDSLRWIHTERTFLIGGEGVTEMTLED